jgi:3,4-dihydroxy 2-butanone 4-phosphate synthase/GTP cyclohydrolase II
MLYHLCCDRPEQGLQRARKNGKKSVTLLMSEHKPPFASIEEAIQEIRAGRMIVLVDDEDRENEGDLTMAAEKVTPEAINFMAKFGRGLICLTLTEQRCELLGLSPISPRNTSLFGTPFCEPIDARVGTTTGTSASDRATTILAATDPKTGPEDLARPGHVYTLRARNGGVLVRAGQTEASVDLSRIAGLDPSGVICEVMNDDGTMARTPQLVEFCRQHGLKLVTVADVIRYRMKHERYVRRIAESVLPTKYGDFRMIAYSSDIDHELHVALVKGDLAKERSGSSDAEIGLVRVHSYCLTGDVLSSSACDCREIINRSLEAIAKAGRGVFVYLHHTGRGFQIDTRTQEDAALPKILYHERGQLDQDLGRQRLMQHESGIGAQILTDLGLRRIRVLTNHPRKLVALEGYGLEVIDQVPLDIGSEKTSHQVF